jgi:uncharacterized SAM-binding protein YcdF (DUF218 family)
MTPKAVAVGLLVPPIALLLAALVGAFIAGRRGRIGRGLLWFGLAGLFVLALPVSGAALMVALERNLPTPTPPQQPPQAIVILGGDVARSGGESIVVDVGPISLERLRTGAALARRTGLPILVTGGSLRANETPVAEVMADSLAQDFQVPARWIEPGSRDTWENAQMSAAILREQGIRSVYVVTQAWHMRRAIMAFAAARIGATPAYPRLDQLQRPWASNFVPDVVGWQESYIALHEWIGCAWYALR